MSPLKLVPITIFFVVVNAHANDPVICEMRANLMGSVAQERDNGVSKEKVKNIIQKKLPGMNPWIDLVYDKMQGIPPNEVFKLTKFSCLRE